MANLYSSDVMAAGYAFARPPVHARVIDLVRTYFAGKGTFRRALDIGCGAGLSTKALQGFADECIGLEPVEAMLHLTPAVAPEARFVAGRAERIPFRGGEFDLMTAAGSLNYVNLDQFFSEAVRVLRPEGYLVVYDFRPGRKFSDSPALAEWHSNFTTRYPWPRSEARPLDPEILAGIDSGFRVANSELFEIALTLTPHFYLEYVLTETNVAFATRNGGPIEAIRTWCAESLQPVWEGRNREVLFSGYFVCMQTTRIPPVR